MKANALILSIAGLFVLCIGCSDSNQFIEVAGTVSVDGQKVDSGKIVFHPTNGSRSGSGPIKEDGSYVISYLKFGDGLPPGEYKVTIVSDKNSQATGQEDEFMPAPVKAEKDGRFKYDPNNQHVVPKEYNRIETTPLTQTISEADRGSQFDFDLETAK